MPTDKALDIIAAEVKHGKCDPELFRLFVDVHFQQIAQGNQTEKLMSCENRQVTAFRLTHFA